MGSGTTTTRRTSIGPVPSQASHDAILDAAEAILTENGSALGFTMEAVAKRAKAGKPTVYRRWKTKGELFLELFATRIAPELPTAEEVPAGTCLRAELADYMERLWSRLTPAKAIVARAVLRELDDDLLRRFDEVLGKRREQFEALGQRAIDRGEIAADYDRATAWQLYVGFNISRLALGQRPEPEELQRAAVAIIEGIRKQPSGRGRDAPSTVNERVTGLARTAARASEKTPVKRKVVALT